MKAKERCAWELFESSGVLWMANNILALVGYEIFYEYKDDKLVSVYPKIGAHPKAGKRATMDGRLDLSEHLEHIAAIRDPEAASKARRLSKIDSKKNSTIPVFWTES